MIRKVWLVQMDETVRPCKIAPNQCLHKNIIRQNGWGCKTMLLILWWLIVYSHCSWFGNQSQINAVLQLASFNIAFLSRMEDGACGSVILLVHLSLSLKDWFTLHSVIHIHTCFPQSPIHSLVYNHYLQPNWVWSQVQWNFTWSCCLNFPNHILLITTSNQLG